MTVAFMSTGLTSTVFATGGLTTALWVPTELSWIVDPAACDTMVPFDPARELATLLQAPAPALGFSDLAGPTLEQSSLPLAPLDFTTLLPISGACLVLGTVEIPEPANSPFPDRNTLMGTGSDGLYFSNYEGHQQRQLPNPL